MAGRGGETVRLVVGGLGGLDGRPVGRARGASRDPRQPHPSRARGRPGQLRARPGAGVRPDVAEVRPGEQLDWVSLETYLRLHLPQAVGDFSVLQFPNGSANLTYLVRFG